MPGIRADRVVIALLLAGGGLAMADEDVGDDAAVDMEFLEYLGSWEATDAEWMLFAGDAAVPAGRRPPVPDRVPPPAGDSRANDRENDRETNDER